jgi:hypothetical protein
MFSSQKKKFVVMKSALRAAPTDARVGDARSSLGTETVEPGK